MTRRRSSYRSLRSLQRDNAACRACAEAGFRIESPPVFEGHEGRQAYILGQAPGVLEAEERRPWRGRAGQALRRWLEMDEERFYATFYCASVTRCYPGRAPLGRGDRTPAPAEQALCSFWWEWELRLLQPEVILVVGGLAARRLLGLTSVTECVGRRYDLRGVTAIPLPHPSGASGWLNRPANRELLERALALVRDELGRIGLAG